MTEILVDVDLNHPPERVWRALTDRTVLSEWFMRTDLEPRTGRIFRLLPDGALGLSGALRGEVVEVIQPRRLVMLWHGEQLHSRVTWEVVPLPEGCRFRLSHTGFIGVHGSERRKELWRAYDHMLSDRLPRVLTQLAAGAGKPSPARPNGRPSSWSAAPPRSTASPPAPASTPATVPPPVGACPPTAAPRRSTTGPAADDDPRPAGVPNLDDAPGDRPPRRVAALRWLNALPHRRRGQILAAAGATLLAVLTFAVISSLAAPSLFPPFGAAPEELPALPPGKPTSSQRVVPPTTPASPGPAAATGRPPLATADSGTSDADRAVAPTRAAPPAREPTDDSASGSSPWAAAYRTTESAGKGFAGEITVTNTSTRPASGWSVVVTLTDGARVTSVKRARASQTGNSVTFSSKNSGKIGPGSSAVLEFQVTGGTRPTGCEIQGQRCGGLSG